eukprot:gnl/Dysnectes_brevis/1847_a2119_2243.p1 GENE.gnl/Dysnectes_brevis/1847_a2119_2243~~gnl/Dysnectes_brevis/1847_a2119_2243.p1  ORF type:complete len:367 (-),score=98.71 gnl/Dysnectes_brevis/1847_a2119_2243:170-1228(-)
MFSCCSSQSDKASRKRSKNIDAVLSKDRETFYKDVKLLLLGAGESGKSTFFKQMRIIHRQGFNPAERLRFKSVIHSNVLSCIHMLITACAELRIPLDSPSHKEIAERVLTIEDPSDFNETIAGLISTLWEDRGIQRAYSQRHLFPLMDSCSYYLNDAGRLAAPSYVPSQQDVLRSRVRTTSIVEITFTVANLQFRLVDVGGQRNERRKWIHVFEGVTAVIFFVAISGYDQVLTEDRKVNRMRESLLLFEEMCNSEWFKDTSFILFLNKVDLFRDKIQRKNITCAFPDYTGPQAFDEAVSYVTDRFLELNRSVNREIFPQLSCSTNTDFSRHVFLAVKNIILRMNLRRAGLGL